MHDHLGAPCPSRMQRVRSIAPCYNHPVLGPANRFVGIDVGGPRGKTTAVAELEAKPDGAHVVFAEARHVGQRWVDETLTAFLSTLTPDDTLVAMAAPLTLPACARCTLPTCPGHAQCVDPAVVWLRRNRPQQAPYSGRVTDVVRAGVPSPASMSPTAARAQHLLRVLSARGFVRGRHVIEVSPAHTLAALQPAWHHHRRHADAWAARADALASVNDLIYPRGSAFAKDRTLAGTHMFDAIICAYTAYRAVTERWQIPSGFEEIAAADGWIWAPPVPGK